MLDRERTLFAWSRSDGRIRIASPQSEVSRLGTGMSLIETPALFRFFSAASTWCVPRKIRMISAGAAGFMSSPPIRLFSRTRLSIIIGQGNDRRETGILGSQSVAMMGIIGATALALNIPLGYLREGRRKYSPSWFLYVHLSIPLIAYLRIANHVTSWLIPFFVLCAAAGQIVGGRFRRRAEKEYG